VGSLATTRMQRNDDHSERNDPELDRGAATSAPKRRYRKCSDEHPVCDRCQLGPMRNGRDRDVSPQLTHAAVPSALGLTRNAELSPKPGPCRRPHAMNRRRRSCSPSCPLRLRSLHTRANRCDGASRHHLDHHRRAKLAAEVRGLRRHTARLLLRSRLHSKPAIGLATTGRRRVEGGPRLERARVTSSRRRRDPEPPNPRATPDGSLLHPALLSLPDSTTACSWPSAPSAFSSAPPRARGRLLVGRTGRLGYIARICSSVCSSLCSSARARSAHTRAAESTEEPIPAPRHR
jgi:hypothetical protein